MTSGSHRAASARHARCSSSIAERVAPARRPTRSRCAPEAAHAVREARSTAPALPRVRAPIRRACARRPHRRASVRPARQRQREGTTRGPEPNIPEDSWSLVERSLLSATRRSCSAFDSFKPLFEPLQRLTLRSKLGLGRGATLLELEKVLCLVAVDFELQCRNALLPRLNLRKHRLALALQLRHPRTQELTPDQREDVTLQSKREGELAVVVDLARGRLLACVGGALRRASAKLGPVQAGAHPAPVEGCAYVKVPRVVLRHE